MIMIILSKYVIAKSDSDRNEYLLLKQIIPFHYSLWSV